LERKRRRVNIFERYRLLWCRIKVECLRRYNFKEKKRRERKREEERKTKF